MSAPDRYFVLRDDEVVGITGFKGPPFDTSIEIAYGTVPGKEGMGFATLSCHELIQMTFEENPEIRVIARTLMQESASTNIMIKKGFKHIGTFEDAEGGQVWEWEYLR